MQASPATVSFANVSFSIGTLNVCGLNSQRKQQQLKALVGRHPVDLLALQETKISSDGPVVRVRNRLDDYDVLCSPALSRSAGCMLLLRKAMSYVIASFYCDTVGRCLVVDVDVQGLELRIITLYAPNLAAERSTFFGDVRRHCSTERQLLILGDFNCVCQASDRSGESLLFHDAGSRQLETLIQEFSLIDVGSSQVQHGLRYTHFQRSSHARLDRIYVPVSFRHNLWNYSVIPCSFSDHCLVHVAIGECRRPPKRVVNWQLWKFNSRLLEDELFRQCTENLIQTSFASVPVYAPAWDAFKLTFRKMAICRASVLAFQQRQKERLLTRQLYGLLRLECESPGQFHGDIENIRDQLEAFDAIRFQGAALRSRMQAFTLTDAPSKAALIEERKHGLLSEVSELSVNGVVTREAKDILGAFHAHYTGIFNGSIRAGPQEDVNELVQSLPRLTECEQNLVNGPLKLDEVLQAIESLQNRKSPGPDGIGSEFYKRYKSAIAPVLLAVFNEAYSLRCLPPSFLRSHTVLIPKSKDRAKLLSVTGYRPIALCNVDYKIFAKILASRLQLVIASLVGEHQTCGIRGRTIQTNTHVARSIVELCRGSTNQAALVQVDLEKAFDRVSHGFLFTVLSHVQLGKVLLDGIALCYRGASTRLVVNHTLTDSIQLKSSVRQGCPMSPLLFALYLEPLCLRVLTNSNVAGFRLHQVEVKVLAYADDLAFFCEDKSSVQSVMEDVSHFACTSGARVNYEKTSGVWLGVWATTPELFCGFSWSTSPGMYLGIPMQHIQCMAPYWSSRIRDVGRSAALWRSWDLSVFSRAQVCNVYLMAKLLYVLQIMSCPRAQIQKLHRVFATFIWNSCYEPMRRDNLFHSVLCGGLGLAHLFVRQITSRLFYVRHQTHPFLRAYHQCMLHNHLPWLYVSSSSTTLRLSSFIREVIAACNFLFVRFSRDYLLEVSREQINGDLVNVLFPTPLYRLPFQGGPGHDILCRVRNMYISASAKSFFFRLHTGTLPVKAWLHERGIFVPWTTNCCWCNSAETIDHCFITCTDAVFFWEVFQRAFKKEVFVNSYSIRFMPVPCNVPIPLDMFMLVGMHCMWKARVEFKCGGPRRCSWTLFQKDVELIRAVYESCCMNDLVWFSTFADIQLVKCHACM